MNSNEINIFGRFDNEKIKNIRSHVKKGEKIDYIFQGILRSGDRSLNGRGAIVLTNKRMIIFVFKLADDIIADFLYEKILEININETIIRSEIKIHISNQIIVLSTSNDFSKLAYSVLNEKIKGYKTYKKIDENEDLSSTDKPSEILEAVEIDAKTTFIEENQEQTSLENGSIAVIICSRCGRELKAEWDTCRYCWSKQDEDIEQSNIKSSNEIVFEEDSEILEELPSENADKIQILMDRKRELEALKEKRTEQINIGY